MDLPQKKLICFFTDGAKVMKILKMKMQEAYSNIIDLGECCLHKVHNSFAQRLSAFGSDIEGAVIYVYYFFKNSALQKASMKAEQVTLGLPETILAPCELKVAHFGTCCGSLDRAVCCCEESHVVGHILSHRRAAASMTEEGVF